MPNAQPIGIFDSGVGGLTVVRALRRLMPGENLLYLGDTARVPYGGKSPATIQRYSIELTEILLERDVKMIVVACNSASAAGLAKLQHFFRIPILGVIEPGVRSALAATRSGHIGVVGTRATIHSAAYQNIAQSIDPEKTLHAQACPLFVPLIEEGWLDHPITAQVIEDYLAPLLQKSIDTLILGCTHYPFLQEAIQKFLGPSIAIIDSATACAREAAQILERKNLLCADSKQGKQADLQVLLTDSHDRFLGMAQEKLGLEIGRIEACGVER